MFKTTRTMWLGIAILCLSCACPEKRAAEPQQATPAVEEPTQVEQPSPEPTPTAPNTPEPGEVPPAATPATPPTPGAGTPGASPGASPPNAGSPPATPAPSPAAGTATGPLPNKAGAPCDARGCDGGYTCVSYYGIAGPKGPEFKSCEIPCPKATDKCPKPMSCTTIADGPGRVCR